MEERFWTIPNALCIVRLVGSPALIVLALREERLLLVATFVFLTLTDWLDGKLAILLDQRSRIGPTLDTIADATMYACLVIGGLLLDGERLVDEWPWLTVAIGSWFVLVAAGYLRFGRWPALHTRPAKIAWGLCALGVVAYLGGWSVWPLRVALVAVALANLYALSVLFTLPEWRTDVASLREARRVRDAKSTAD